MRREPALPAHDFIGRMNAAVQPLALAHWETRPRYGARGTEEALARSACESPALGFLRWFAEKSAFDGLSAGSTCVWFLGLRFVNPGRHWVPFQYGACRDSDAAPWRAFERSGAGGRTPVD